MYTSRKHDTDITMSLASENDPYVYTRRKHDTDVTAVSPSFCFFFFCVPLQELRREEGEGEGVAEFV